MIFQAKLFYLFIPFRKSICLAVLLFLFLDHFPSHSLDFVQLFFISEVFSVCGLFFIDKCLLLAHELVIRGLLHVISVNFFLFIKNCD